MSCFINIQTGLTFLVPAYPGWPEKQAVKRVSVFLPPLLLEEDLYGLVAQVLTGWMPFLSSRQLHRGENCGIENTRKITIAFFCKGTQSSHLFT